MSPRRDAGDVLPNRDEIVRPGWLEQWAGLSDARALTASVGALREMERVTPEEFRRQVLRRRVRTALRAKVAAVKAQL